MILQDIKIMLLDPIFNSLQGLDTRSPMNFKHNKNIFNIINKKYNCFTSSELIYLLRNKNNLENLHIFCKCGNKNSLINTNRGYHKFCSFKCANSDKEVIEKIKQIKLNNIDENGLNSYERGVINERKNRLNDIDKNGRNSYQRVVYNRINDIDENGLNAYQRAAIKGVNKKLNTLDNNGNNIFNLAIQKQIKTMHEDIDEFGNNAYTRSRQKQSKYMHNDIDENGHNAYTRSRIKQRVKMLNDIDENGLNGYDRSRQKARKTSLSNIDENGNNSYQRAAIKIYNTKKKNGTHSSSNPEKQIFHLLMCKFPDIVWHYKDKERYNFNCDFYIPSIDTFIEINFAFEHGGEPFDSNNSNHLKEIQRCKIKSKEIGINGKNKTRYSDKIKVWTEKDPLKLNIAKQNNLNYLAFYNWKEFNNWFNNI